LIGNDIIDLEVPISRNWNTKRYLDKLFNPKEQKYIALACSPKSTMQLLWSLKEASYKAHQRRFNLPRKFNPIEFQCKLTLENNTSIQGLVNIDRQTYYTNSTITSAFIHSVATLKKDQATSIKIFEGKKALHNEIIAEFSLILEEPMALLKIQKNNNFIPNIIKNNLKLDHAFSPSHHGKFSAFVIALMNS